MPAPQVIFPVSGAVGQTLSGKMASHTHMAMEGHWCPSQTNVAVVPMTSFRMSVPAKPDLLGPKCPSGASIRHKLQTSQRPYSQGLDMAFGDAEKRIP